MYAATGRTGIVIARFWPGTASVFFPQALHELRDLNIDLADLIPPKCVREITHRVQEARHTPDRLAAVESFLKARLRPDRASANARHAVGQIIAAGGCRSVNELAQTLHVGSRQLQRWFRQNVGIGPKALGRIARLQHAIDIRASGRSWGMAAHSAGYQDQSHLINECRALSGLSPVEVFRRRRSTALASYFNTGPGISPFWRTLYA